MRDSLLRDCLALGLPDAPALPVGLSRRGFIAGAASSLLTGVALGGETAAPAVDASFWQRPRELWLKRAETDEELRVHYWADGDYLSDGYSRLCWLLRDVREGQAVQMDTALIDVLTGIQAYYQAYDLGGPLIVTSGYRSAATNEALLGEGASKNSMHLYGRAVDITLPGASVEHLGRVKQYLHAGGLGFYPTRNFIHIDTGRKRVWRG